MQSKQMAGSGGVRKKPASSGDRGTGRPRHPLAYMEHALGKILERDKHLCSTMDEAEVQDAVTVMDAYLGEMIVYAGRMREQLVAGRYAALHE